MWTAFPFLKRRKYARLRCFAVRILLAVGMLIERAPAGFKNFFARCFKRNAIYLTLNGRGGKFAIGIEHADETHGNKLEDVLFALR